MSGIPHAGPITVDGQVFVAVPGDQTSAGQDAYLMDHIAAAGLGEIDQLLMVGQSSSAPSLPPDLQALATHAVARAAGSGRLFKILAGMYVPEGEKWSRDGAARVESALEGVADPTAKAAIWQAVAAVVLGFFVTAAASSGISLSSLADRGAARSATAAPSTSESSPT